MPVLCIVLTMTKNRWASASTFLPIKAVVALYRSHLLVGDSGGGLLFCVHGSLRCFPISHSSLWHRWLAALSFAAGKNRC